MSKQILRVKYHPAKKEIQFQIFQGETEIPVNKGSRLLNYMNRRGEFILQDQGNAFLTDIVKTFSGERVVNLELITTKIDYEDFTQMVEYFNESSPKIKIDVTSLAELRDMDEIYTKVKEHGERSIGILEHHQAKFFSIPRDNDKANECVRLFSEEIQKEVKSIKEKIQAMADNNINLCFAGVFSSGKSALINAILGYAILPEKTVSETAKMFRIQSPRAGGKVRIIFQINTDFTELVWDDSDNKFVFSAGPNEGLTRESINDAMEKNREKHQSKQILEILRTLNKDSDVSLDVKVYFPVPLDNDKLRFTIYDTPGTDSNQSDHVRVLKNALSEQTHSILVFVAHPHKTEGEGNRALLNYLKEAEKKDSKTSIDLGRSLFVINHADATELDERRKLHTEEIKNKVDPDFSIKLSDKKLFFTSAKVAYAAKAKKNGIETKNDERTIKEKSVTISDDDVRYYQQNRCATSEYATGKMIDLSTSALENAEKDGNILDILYISYGVYALENEILLYGEKFAVAVRAFAIIDSVDKALSKMNKNAKDLEKQNQQDINKVNKEIESLKAAISDSIKQAYKEHEIPKNAALPKKIQMELHLDPSILNAVVIGEPKTFIDKLLKKWFFDIFGKVHVKKEHKREIDQKITATLDDFTRNFLEKRQYLLEKQRDAFIETVKQIIHANGNLSDEAKEFILDIRKPELKKPANIADFGEIYDAYKRTTIFFFQETEYILKDQFIQDVERKLSDIATSMATEYERDYRKSLTSILSAVESEFNLNLDKYSVLMKAKLEDKKAMELLREKITKAAGELEECQKELEKLIWSEKSNER